MRSTVVATPAGIEEHLTAAATLAHVRRLVDLLPAGACLCDVEGRIVHVTRRASLLWGRSAIEGDAARWSRARSIFDEHGVAVLPEALPIARAVGDGEAQPPRRLQFGRIRGRRRHVVSHASPLHDDRGRLVGGLDLIVDVTAQHHAALAERERLVARGEQLVALACDIRAGLTPLRRSARQAGPEFDERLRDITCLVDRVLNLEVDVD